MRAAVVVVALLAAGCNGPSAPQQRAAQRRATQVRDLAAQAGLPAAARDVFALAARGAAATYTATYTTAGDTLVISHRGANLRVDTEDGGTVLVLGSTTYVCDRSSCQRSAQPYEGLRPLDEGALRDLLRSWQAARGVYTFHAGTRVIASTRARCVTVTGPSSAMLCVSPDGVPLLVETPTASLHATRYRTSVAGDAFRLPAPTHG